MQMNLVKLIERELHEPYPDRAIYFVTCGEYVKIGSARDIGKRLSELKCGNPHKIEVAAWLPGTYALERLLHCLFAAHSHRDEWFVAHDDIQAFMSRHGKSGPPPVYLKPDTRVPEPRTRTQHLLDALEIAKSNANTVARSPRKRLLTP